MARVRYGLLDALRGITLLSMIAYHVSYDLVELYGVKLPWFWESPGYLWQQSICWTFILLSGFCWKLGRSPVRRGVEISACGALISLVTCMFLPSAAILFGILTFTGAAMLLTALLAPALRRIPDGWGILGSGALFFLTRNINSGYWGFEGAVLGRVPEFLYQDGLLTFLGFPDPGFYSGDYFSLFPWFFLYLCGYFLHGFLLSRKEVRRALGLQVPGLGLLGRYTLPVYMLHQPVALLILEMIF